MVSCNKETASEEGVVSQSQIIKEFDTCNCSSPEGKEWDDEYIKADINDVPVCFDQSPSLGDTFPNTMRYGFILRDTGNQYYDNLCMIRNAKNSHWQVALFFENTYALTKTFPYQLPRENSEVCEIGELQLNNLDHYISCAWCAENTFNYFALFWRDGVKMTVTSFNDNVFEGIFSGTLSTGSGRRAVLTNGKFRIKLVVFRSDIEVN